MEQTPTLRENGSPIGSISPFLRKEQQLMETKAFSRSLPIEGGELTTQLELLK